MKEFMLLIRTEGDHLEKMSQEEHQEHLEKISEYISKLIKEEKLKAAQPLDMEGSIITNKNGSLKDGPFNESKEVIAGYFHILANNLEEATEIARQNPMVIDNIGRIEVRPIKQIENINK